MKIFPSYFFSDLHTHGWLIPLLHIFNNSSSPAHFLHLKTFLHPLIQSILLRGSLNKKDKGSFFIYLIWPLKISQTRSCDSMMLWLNFKWFTDKCSKFKKTRDTNNSWKSGWLRARSKAVFSRTKVSAVPLLDNFFLYNLIFLFYF